MNTAQMDPETARRRAAATAAWLEELARLSERTHDGKSAATSPESVANVRAHAAAIRKTL